MGEIGISRELLNEEKVKDLLFGAVTLDLTCEY
jgi:hypothetical protein